MVKIINITFVTKMDFHLESTAEMRRLAHRPLGHLVDDVVQHHHVLASNHVKHKKGNSAVIFKGKEERDITFMSSDSFPPLLRKRLGFLKREF